jgi:hypothetical protein
MRIPAEVIIQGVAMRLVSRGCFLGVPMSVLWVLPLDGDEIQQYDAT